MAGDPWQLGPVVASRLASQSGLDTSLLERLMNLQLYSKGRHMGREADFREKKCTIPKLNVFICTLVVGITSQNFKIGPLGDFEKTRFCVFFWPKNTF